VFALLFALEVTASVQIGWLADNCQAGLVKLIEMTASCDFAIGGVDSFLAGSVLV